MLYLTRNGLKDRVAYENAGISLPEYNVTEVAAHTAEHPVWVHFGAGNIFRGFIAVLQQSLLNQGLEKSGIIAAETFDFDMAQSVMEQLENYRLPDSFAEKYKKLRVLMAEVARDEIIELLSRE